MAGESYNCIVILGPTASGKTRLACEIAAKLNGEIISADSRQVYKGLDLASGKDLAAYIFNGTTIRHHLIDIADPREQYYLHQFQADLKKTFYEITVQGKVPVVCGGTGLYLEALQKDFSYTQVPENPLLRGELIKYSKNQLIRRLDEYNPAITGHVDRTSVKRLIRGIEVAEYLSEHSIEPPEPLPYKPFYVGTQISLSDLKANIHDRLNERLKQGMIQEIGDLMKAGVPRERMQQLGLEFRYISDLLSGNTDLEKMRAELSESIFAYARRQMTWFRRMERQGVAIHWVKPGDSEKLLFELQQYFGVEG